MITLNGENAVTLTYDYAGMFVSQHGAKPWIHPRRTIHNYEVIFVKSGTVYLQVGENAYEMHENDVLLIPPNVLHFGYRESDPAEKTSFYWLHFLTSDVDFFAWEKNFCHLTETFRLRELFKQLLHDTRMPDYATHTADLYTAMILNEIAAKIRLASESSKGVRLAQEMMEWIRINVSDSCIGVDDVSAYFGYNGDYLSKLFRRNFGITVKDYIIEEKIKYAKQLLTESSYSVKEISDMLGYENENRFIKFFVYHENITPVRYRNTYFNTHMNKK